MIMVSLKPLIKVKIDYPAEALCDFKREKNQSILREFFFIVKTGIIVCYCYNKYETLCEKFKQKR